MQAALKYEYAPVVVASNGYAMERTMAPGSADEPAQHGVQAHSRSGEHQKDAEPDHAAEGAQTKDQADTTVGKQKQATRPDRKPARNRACPCGKGRRYKDCCGPVQAAVERRAVHGAQNPETSQEHGTCLSRLYI